MKTKRYKPQEQGTKTKTDQEQKADEQVASQ